jgi:hypothetical protein
METPTMIRTLMTFAFGLVVLGLSAVPAIAAPEDDPVQKKLDDIQKKLDGLVQAHNQLTKLTETDIKDLKDEMRDLRTKTTEAITDINRRLDDLKKRLDGQGSGGGRVAGAIDPTLGRLNLRNRWDMMVTFSVNGRSYSVAPQQDLVVDLPAGPITYQIVGDGYGVIDPMRTIDLRAGQAINMEVFRR